MLESVNDSEVARALVDAAAAWLRDRGRAEMLGPIDYSTNYPCGLLIDGFDTPPRIMMNHHRPYYAELLEASGLKKAKDLYAWWFEDPDDMLAKWRCRAERLTARGNIKIRPFDRRDFAADVERCKRIYHAAWERNWGFVRMTDEEFTAMAEELRRFAIPELLLLAEVDGNAVGCAVTLPDLNEATCHLNGRLTTFGLPIGLFKLMWRMRKIKTARMLIFGVLEDYRRRGVAELLILRSLDCGKNTLGFTGAELGWTLEDNHLINRTIEAVGARRYKTYRIYGKSIC
jgi:GNAT superfamily N-acetyltransferase